MPDVVVLDYGSGNIRSAHRALERVGASVTVTADLTAAGCAHGLVIPGVGAFAACMAGLAAVGAPAVIVARLSDDRPVLGICVGMQVLFEVGVEHGVATAGLGIVAGRVEPLSAPVVPHMGWNTVTAPARSTLFAGLPADARYYFVHSYAVAEPAMTAPAVTGPAAEGPVLIGTTGYGTGRFVAAVEHGALSATQFHPEKSGDAGAALLENWVKTL